MRYVPLLLLLFLAQCKDRSVPAGGSGPTTNPPANGVTVTVTFADLPVSPTVAVADLKYDKTVGFALVKDDGGPGDWTTVYPYLWGGLAADGVTYPGLSYTDGAGKQVKWHYTFALNWNQGQLTNALSSAKHLEMIQAGFADVSNHSLTHAGYYDRAYEVKTNEINIYNHLGGYRTRTFTIPTAYEGFVETSFALGYRLTASQGYGPGGSASDDNNGPTTYDVLWGERVKGDEARRLITTRRFFGNAWTAADLATAKTFVDQAFSASTGLSAATKFVYQGFSHGPTYSATDPDQFSNFQAFAQYISTHPANRDQIWVAGLQELVDYMDVKTTVVRSQVVSGHTLVLTLDYDKVSDNVRWRDLSLLVGGGSVTNVSVSGADDFSFNSATGLINIYKKKTTGFSDPARDILPPALTAVQINTATGILLTFDRPVNQDRAAAWTVTSDGTLNPITALTGSGTNWQLAVKNPMTTGQAVVVDYRMQRGNAADAVTGQKVVAYIGYPASNKL